MTDPIDGYGERAAWRWRTPETSTSRATDLATDGATAPPEDPARRAFDRDWVEPYRANELLALLCAGPLTAEPPRGAQRPSTRTSDVAPSRAQAKPLEVPEALAPYHTGLVAAGMDPVDALALLQHGASPEEARELALRMFAVPIWLESVVPRATALSLLQSIAEKGGASPEIVRRELEARSHLEVVRPDGYLCAALSGRPLERVGTPKLEGDRLFAGPLEVGRFYHASGGVLREVGLDLQPDHARSIAYEHALQHECVGSALDGVEDALTAMAMGVGRVIEDPLRTLDDLAKLPAVLASVIAASPALAEQLLAMPGRDQARVLSQVVFTLLAARAGAASVGGALADLGPGAGLGSGNVSLSGALAWTAQLEVSFAPALAGAAAAGGTVAVVLGPAQHLAEPGPESEVTKSGMKTAGKAMSKEGAKAARLELPKIEAERQRVLKILDRLLEDPRVKGNQTLGSWLRSTRNAVANHLKSEDLVGALRDALGVEVRAPGSGAAYDHADELRNALNSIHRARQTLIRLLANVRASRHEFSGLSEDIDTILEFAKRVRAFLELR